MDLFGCNQSFTLLRQLLPALDLSLIPEGSLMSEVAFPAATLAVRRTVDQPGAGTPMPSCARRPWTFETVYLSEMLTHMGVAREPETFGGGFGAEAFQSLLNEAYAERIVGRGGIGIAEMVYRQLRAAIAP